MIWSLALALLIQVPAPAQELAPGMEYLSGAILRTVLASSSS